MKFGCTTNGLLMRMRGKSENGSVLSIMHNKNKKSKTFSSRGDLQDACQNKWICHWQKQRTMNIMHISRGIKSMQ